MAAVPPALFHDDGSMRKTSKAELAKKLENTCEGELHSLPSIVGSTASIIDGMALLQCQNEASFNSFEDLGNLILHHIRYHLVGHLGIDLVVLVFDRYDVPHSIKQFERAHRGTTTHGSAASYVITGNRSVPNYRKFLSNSANKAALANFISMHIMKNAKDTLVEGQKIIIDG